MKPKRFFYHYFKQGKCMSVHFNKQCIKVDDIRCNVPSETKWNKIQPHLVVRGFASDVQILEENGRSVAVII